jgi:hypothetical protein
MFDITRFELLKDEENVFFRLTLRDLTEPVTNPSTRWTYTTGVTIALKRGDEFSGRLQKSCHGIVFGEGKGYDFRMDVGRAICLSDNIGKAFYLTPDISDSMISLDDNIIQFSLPLSMTGAPQGDWEILVGAYLLNDYGLGFLRGGPEPIHHRPGVFAVGGGEDVEYSPKFIDILLPEGVDQAELLSSYDAGSGRRAVVPMLSLEM